MMIRGNPATAVLAVIFVLALSAGLPSAAQEKLSFRSCTDMPIEILNAEDAPVRLRDGTRLCRAPGDFPAGEQRSLNARLLVENVSNRHVVALEVSWVSHDEKNPQPTVSRRIDTARDTTRPLKLRPYKRRTYDFKLPVTMPGHATHVTSIFIYEVVFEDGSEWSTTLSSLREESRLGGR